jgi:hypothetical protein
MLPAAALSQTPKPAPKKPPVKTAAKPAAKPAAPKPEPPPPDLSVTSRYLAGDKTTAGTVMMHGPRQRVSYDSGMSSIQQCDAHQNIQLNADTRVYLAIPDPVAPDPTAAAAPTGKQKGGHITYATTVVDTGEHKEMFGFPVRRLKTTVTKEASADAWDKKPERVEIDGWYADLPESISCTGAPAPERELRVDPKDAATRDVVSYLRPPPSRAYPFAYTMVTSSGNEAPVTTTMEATEVQRTKLDPQLFEVPADYVAVRSAIQLAADHRPDEDGPKKPGTIRIGIAPLQNSSGQSMSTTDLTQGLADSFAQNATDAVLLKGTNPAELAEEAKQRSCDFILTNNVSEMKHPGKGMLGKIGGAPADGLAAKVDYALASPGAGKATLNSSEHSGASSTQSALNVAKRVSVYVTPMMMMRSGYMQMFSSMGNTAPGMMAQTQDPVFSSVFRLVDMATKPKIQVALTSEDAAAGAALQKEVDSVLSELKKRKM